MSNPQLTDADLKKQMAGRKVIGTHGEWPAKIFECVERRRNAGQSIGDVFWQDVKNELDAPYSWSMCKHLNYEYKKKVLPTLPTAAPDSKPPSPELPRAAPAGRWMFFLQKYRVSAVEAHELVERLVLAAGPHRALYLDLLFQTMEKRREQDYGRRIAWLKRQITRMENDPVYFPQPRARPVVTQIDLVRKAFREAPANQLTKAKVCRRTGITPNSVSNLISRLLADREIVPLKPGLYALSYAAEKPWRPTRETILEVLRKTPHDKVTRDELEAITGKTRRQLTASIFNLKVAGVVIYVERGAIALRSSGLKSWCPPSEAIMRALNEAPGNQATTDELVAATGKTRIGIISAIEHLVDAGRIIRVGRGKVGLRPARKRA